MSENRPWFLRGGPLGGRWIAIEHNRDALEVVPQWYDDEPTPPGRSGWYRVRDNIDRERCTLHWQGWNQ